MVTTLFTTLDLLKVYHNIKVEECSREKTAFTTNIGLFQYIHLLFRLTDASASQKKSGVVISITISSQHCHISCSVMVDTGFPVTLLSELPYIMSLKLHYHFFGATCHSLNTLGTAQIDIVMYRNVWPTPAIVVSSIAHPLILGLNSPRINQIEDWF